MEKNSKKNRSNPGVKMDIFKTDRVFVINKDIEITSKNGTKFKLSIVTKKNEDDDDYDFLEIKDASGNVIETYSFGPSKIPPPRFE